MRIMLLMKVMFMSCTYMLQNYTYLCCKKGGAFAIALITMLSLSQNAHATSFCEIKKTKDGYVALRAAPDQNAPLKGRMTSSDEIMLLSGKKGDWQHVRWWKGDDRHIKGFDAFSGEGWMNGKLIEADSCG